MPLPLIAIIGINIGIGLLITALSYLLRPHQKKMNSFDSPTYGWVGMTNSYEPGTPLNLPYGTMEIPPAIVNWYRRGNGGKTRAYFIGSLGHGQIAGCRGVMLNGLPIRHYYSKFNKDCAVYITHGEYQQKVYKFCKEVKGYLVGAPSGTSPTKTLTVVVTNSRTFQSASAKEPGYLLLYSSGTDNGKETYEFVRYLSSSNVGSTWTFKGVRVTKSFIDADNVVQMYKIEKDDDGNVRETIPHIGSVSTYHQNINNIELTTDWSSIFTTHGKVDSFSTTFDFPEGLYKFDEKKGGYQPNQVEIAIRWKAVDSGSWVEEGTTRTVLPGTEHKIDVTKNTNYAIIVDETTGVEITGTQEDFDFLDDIEEGMEIEFQGISKGTSAPFTYVIDSVISEATGTYGTSVDDRAIVPLYRGKIKFKSRINPSESSKGKYEGGNVQKVAYSIYYYKSINVNSAKIKIPESPKTIQSSYQVTYQFPQDGKGQEEKLTSYKQHQIQYKLVSPTTTHSATKDAHKIVITSIEDIKLDDLVYPGEALIGMRLLMTEKISGSLDNITAVVDGLLIKDTSEDISGLTAWAGSTVYSSLTETVSASTNQPVRRKPLAAAKDCQHAYRLIKIGTSGSTEPDWLPISGAVIFDGTCEWQEDSCKWSDNPLDIICDLQQNKIYGRGEYLDFDNTILNDLYDSYNVDDSNSITDREYAEHIITENSKARKRLSVNINIDFRQPLIDTLEVLAKSIKGYNFWDGQKLLTYIDRYRTPVTIINNANIIPDSFVINEVNVEDKINRLYASILNRYRGYKQDQVARDYIDEGFAIGDLIMEQIHLYGISDKWHSIKILSYMLKYSKYIKHIIAFEQGIDACVYDVGDVFYFSHEAVNNSVQIGTTKKWASTCGRVIAVSGATFTTDKDVTIANGQEVLLRTDTGTATKYTINSQVGRVITCSATITSVSINSIYSLGATDSNNEYYRLFTCIAKRPKEYTYEVVAITYDDNVFKDIYDTTTPSQETSGIVPSIVEENDALNEIDFSKSPPPPVVSAVVKEDPLVQGEAIIYISAPIGGNWSHAEIYVKNMDSEEWKFAGKSIGDPTRITGLIAGEVYEYEIKSYSTGAIVSDIKIHGTFEYGTDSNSIDLPRPTGFQIANRMGTLGDVYGRGFRFRWDDMTSQTKESLTYAMRKAGYEQIKYYLEIYFSAIPTTVKIGNTNVKDMIARHETLTDNKLNYDYEDTMEDISKIFEKYSTHSSYNTYYNVPQRTIKAKLYCINNYSKKSSPAELTLTNPAPGAYLSDGSTKITPTLKKLKSGVRVSFPHPYDSNADEEYDISHFISERCENTNFTGNTLKKRKIISSITVNSNDEEVSDASYQTDYKGLDPKKTYYFRIKAFDVFGGGIYSEIASIAPGVTDDDEEDVEEKIAPPGQASGVALAINSNNNVIVQWTKPAGNDATDVVEVIVDWRASQFTGTPNQTLTPIPPAVGSGNIPRLSEVDQGFLDSDNTKLVIGEKRVVKLNTDETESHTKNSIVIKGAKTGYTYEARVRFRNSSGKEGAWSAWAYNATAVSGISDDDFSFKFKKVYYTGTISATDYRKATWTTVVLKVYKSGGGTTPYTITNGNTGNLATDGTGNRWIVWRSDYLSGTTFEVITDATLSDDVTYKDAVAIAYVIPTSNTDGKITVVETIGTNKDTIFSSAIIAANSILANHIKVNSLSAISAILGTLLMSSSDGSSITLKDSAGTKRIFLSTQSGATPVLRISKATKDASTALSTDDCLFTSEDASGKAIDSFKIEQSGWENIDATNFPSQNVSANSTGAVQFKYVATTGITTKRSVFACLRDSSSVIPAPYIQVIKCDADGLAFINWYIYHQLDGGGVGQIVVARQCYNNSGVQVTMDAGSSTDYAYWAIMTETID